MKNGLHHTIETIIKNIDPSGTLIASSPERGFRIRKNTPEAHLVIRAVYASTLSGDMLHPSGDDAVFTGEIPDTYLTIRLYHINDMIRFILEGDGLFLPFLFAEKEKCDPVWASQFYSSDAFNILRENRSLFISKELVLSLSADIEDRLEEIMNIEENTSSHELQEHIENEVNETPVSEEEASIMLETRRHMMLAETYRPLLMLRSLAYDSNTGIWSMESHNHKKESSVIAAIARGSIPFAEGIVKCQSLSGKLKSHLLGSFNLPDRPDAPLMRSVLDGFYRNLHHCSS